MERAQFRVNRHNRISWAEIPAEHKHVYVGLDVIKTLYYMSAWISVVSDRPAVAGVLWGLGVAGEISLRQEHNDIVAMSENKRIAETDESCYDE